MVTSATSVNKYKDNASYLPDTDETYHVDDDGIQFLRGFSGGGPSMEILTSQK